MSPGFSENSPGQKWSVEGEQSNKISKPVMCCVCVLRPVSVFCILRYVRRECQAFLEVFQEIFPPIDVTLRRVGR